jgi:hypothetical protein
MARRVRLLVWPVVACLLAVQIFPVWGRSPINAGAQPNCQQFSETGYTLCDRFLEYWQQHGGLAQHDQENRAGRFGKLPILWRSDSL